MAIILSIEQFNRMYSRNLPTLRPCKNYAKSAEFLRQLKLRDENDLKNTGANPPAKQYEAKEAKS